MAKEKLDFKLVNYDRRTIRWGVGNDAVGLHCIATIKTRELTKKEEKEELKDWLEAKEIFDTYINVGQKFKPIGKTANKKIVAKITYIHNEKQSVTWKQCNLSDEAIQKGLKPAAGKWNINSMLSLYRAKEISFLK